MDSLCHNGIETERTNANGSPYMRFGSKTDAAIRSAADSERAAILRWARHEHTALMSRSIIDPIQTFLNGKSGNRAANRETGLPIGKPGCQFMNAHFVKSDEENMRPAYGSRTVRIRAGRIL